MSELKEFLSAVQLIKHYELLQFLSKHPNVEYTLSQLDFLLPRGASLQRFPLEWTEYMRSGQCGNHNIELSMGEGTGGGVALDNGDDEGCESRLEEICLICRRPEVSTLPELQTLVQSPATLPDMEGCVALHTDQILLPNHLLRAAQRTGLAYYFPDAYSKRDTALGLNASQGVGMTNNSSAALESLLSSKEELLSRSSGVPTTVVALPPGIRTRFRLVTNRGVAVQDEHCIPVRMSVGERLLMTFDNENARRRGIPGSSEVLRVGFHMRSASRDEEELSANPPLRIRMKTVQGGTSGATRVQVDMEALLAIPVKLIIVVNSIECLVDMSLHDVELTTPGVLIGREADPGCFSLPPAYRLQDSLVCPTPWESSAITAESDSARESTTTLAVSGFSASPVLPWWLSSSPVVLAVRDATYPLEETTKAATELVFAKQARRHEADLRAARQAVTAHLMVESGGKKRRYRSRADQDLRNRHMLHWGLDASVPFVVLRER